MEDRANWLFARSLHFCQTLLTFMLLIRTRLSVSISCLYFMSLFQTALPLPSKKINSAIGVFEKPEGGQVSFFNEHSTYSCNTNILPPAVLILSKVMKIHLIFTV